MEEKAKILIIEDDQDVIAAMRVALEAQQYQVDSAIEPEEGLSKARQWRPNLVILDVMFGRRQQAKGFEAAISRRKPTAGTCRWMGSSKNRSSRRTCY